MELSGADILAIKDRNIQPLDVPEWNNGTIYIRDMGAVERAKFDVKLIEIKDMELSEKMVFIKITLIMLCASNREGKRLFKDTDFDAIAEKSTESIDRVYKLIDKMNILTQGEVENEKEK